MSEFIKIFEEDLLVLITIVAIGLVVVSYFSVKKERFKFWLLTFIPSAFLITISKIYSSSQLINDVTLFLCSLITIAIQQSFQQKTSIESAENTHLKKRKDEDLKDYRQAARVILNYLCTFIDDVEESKQAYCSINNMPALKVLMDQKPSSKLSISPQPLYDIAEMRNDSKYKLMSLDTLFQAAAKLREGLINSDHGIWQTLRKAYHNEEQYKNFFHGVKYKYDHIQSTIADIYLEIQEKLLFGDEIEVKDVLHGSQLQKFVQYEDYFKGKAKE